MRPVLILVLVVGCSDTALLVDVGSELVVPSGADALRIDAVGERSGGMLHRTIALTTPFPHSFAIAPKDDPTETVAITVTATLAGGDVLRASARAAFREGQTIHVPIDLDARCVGVSCAAGQTCIDGVCTGERLDAGLDATMDDAGADANLDDGGMCRNLADCEDGVECTRDACVAGECQRETRDELCAAEELCTIAGCRSATCGAAPSVAVTGNGGRYPLRLAPGTETGSCGGMGAEAYLTLDLAAESDVFVAVRGAGATAIYVRSGACEGTEVACAVGLETSTVQRRLPAGTHFIVVDSELAMSSMVEADVNVTPPATDGDACGHPLAFSGDTIMGMTCGLTSDVSGACSGGKTDAFDGPDAVYWFAVRTAGPVTFDACAACTDYRVSLEVRRVCQEPMVGSTRVACSSGGCRSTCAGGGPPSQTQLSTDLTPGLYYLVVDGRGAACGSYGIRASGL
jgi:hypothetical protein